MIWKFGDNINTDLITPGRYNITTDPLEMAKIAFVEYRPEFAKRVKKGDLIIAGNNFGSGSSRETAAIALKYCGLPAIVAKSFARIFFRNCLNQGLLTIVADATDFDESDRVELDLAKQVLRNKTKETTVAFAISAFALKLHNAGGIIAYVKKHGIASLKNLESL